MPDTRDDNERGSQKRDQWGGVFQNEYGRILGNIESQLDFQSEALKELKNEGKGRDRALKDIEDRVRANAHKAGERPPGSQQPRRRVWTESSSTCRSAWTRRTSAWSSRAWS
jgi:hypothetical protein